jgi:hypothetical protein
MDTGRVLTRLALASAFAIAAGIPVVAFIDQGADKPETWTILAAALAVITSIIATWASRRVVELQEVAQRANPYPIFDLTSRYGLAMLRIKNTGATAAHNISLKWNIDLKNHRGEIIGFAKEGSVPGITTLLPGESISQIIGPHHEFINGHPDGEFAGTMMFEDPSRRSYKRAFRLDGRTYSGSPSYDEEAVKTHYELQKIPKEIETLRKVLEKKSWTR